MVRAGTFLSSLFVFALPKSRFTMALIAGMAMSLGLVFFFILGMDHPFAGKESVDREPLELTQEHGPPGRHGAHVREEHAK